MAHAAALPRAVHTTLPANAATGLRVAGIAASSPLKPPPDAVECRPPQIALLEAAPAARPQAVHRTRAGYAGSGLGGAGIDASLLLKHAASAFTRRALVIALLVGGPAAVLQPVSGDFAARHVARYQPTKLAAAEALFETKAPAPLVIGGWPDMRTRTTPGAIEIPYGLSLLAFHDP